MSNFDYQLLKVHEVLIKTINNGFLTLNANITDCAKSLQILANSCRKNEEDYWHPVLGENGCVPGPEYDWVLVKIRDISDKNAKIYNIPHIAEYHNGKWKPQEWFGCYGTPEIPFEVVYWRPIPEDTSVTLYDGNGKNIRSDHIYE